MEQKIVYLEKAGSENTDTTLELVRDRLKKSDIKKLILASTTGATARKSLELFKDMGIKLIVIPHQHDFLRKENAFPKDLIKNLRDSGHEVHFGTMLFHTEKLYGINTPALIANFLRCFCEGVKVCYEIILMATDAGLVKTGEQVIAVAGTGLGADTALVMQAASSQNLKKLRINEIICKPINLGSDEE